MKKSRIPTSKKEVLDIALFYCSHRETSRPKLRSYLLRKIPNISTEESEADDRGHKKHSFSEWIEQALDDCERLKIIDHERFAGMLIREYERRGKGKRYVDQKLKERGLDAEIPEREFSADDEYERALALAEKTFDRSNVKREEDSYKRRQKVMQKLVSSGFDFSIAKRAIDAALKKTS